MKKTLFIFSLVLFLNPFHLFSQKENNACTAVCLPSTGIVVGKNPDADGWSPNDVAPCGDGTSEDNPLWYTFVASGSSFTLSFVASGCIGGSGSLQVTFFEGIDCNKLAWTGVCANCVTNGTLTLATIPSKQYWLQIDGCAESVCNFTLNYNSNDILKSVPTPSVTGLKNICSGSTTNYQVTMPPGFNPTDYTWKIDNPAGGIITNNNNGTISFAAKTAGNYQLMVTPKFSGQCVTTTLPTAVYNITVGNTLKMACTTAYTCQNSSNYIYKLGNCLLGTGIDTSKISPKEITINQICGTTKNQTINVDLGANNCAGTVQLTSTICNSWKIAQGSVATVFPQPRVIDLKPLIISANPTFNGTPNPAKVTLSDKPGTYLKKIKYKVDSTDCEGEVWIKLIVLKKGKLNNFKEEVSAKNRANDSESIDNQEAKNLTLNVKPNPSDGIFNLKVFNAKTDYSVAVYNPTGQVVFEGNNVELIDLQSFATGFYILKVNTGEWTKVVRLVKK